MSRMYVLAAAFAVAFTSSAMAADVVVKKNDDLQAAIDAAVDGDTITVVGGKRAGPINVVGKTNLTIIGKRGAKIQGGAPGLLINNSDGIEIMKMKVQNTSTHGIEIRDSSDVTIDGCKIQKTSEAGIWTFDCDSITIQNCKIKKNGEDGIALSDDESGNPTTNSIVQDTKIQRSSDDAIDALGDNNTFRRLKLIRPGGGGIDLDEGLNNVIEDVKVIRPGEEGLDLDATCAIMRIKIIRAGDNGIEFDDSDGSTISDSKIIKSTGIGIRVESAVTITNNVIKKSSDVDIEDLGGDGTYSGNTFKTSRPDPLGP